MKGKLSTELAKVVEVINSSTCSLNHLSMHYKLTTSTVAEQGGRNVMNSLLHVRKISINALNESRIYSLYKLYFSDTVLECN